MCIIGLICTLKPDPVHRESKNHPLAFKGLICCPLNISISSSAAADKLLLIMVFGNEPCWGFYYFHQDPTKVIIMYRAK